jgi:ABC-type phosphate transport system substrate-binding protein
MKAIVSSVFLCFLFLLPVMARAGVAIIASPSTAVGALTADEVGQVYLGRMKTLPDGSPVSAVDQQEGSASREEFLDRVLGKNQQQLRSYWTRMVFTGKGQPPRSVGNDAEVIRAVLSAPGVIGYVDSSAVTAKVKVLYRVD